MIPLLLRFHTVGVDEDAQRTAVDNEPGNKSAKLRGREEVHLEHGHGMWADRAVEEGVDA